MEHQFAAAAVLVALLPFLPLFDKKERVDRVLKKEILEITIPRNFLRNQKVGPLVARRHENLTYLNFEGTDKVRRWKMLVMQFDFDINFLAGVKNGVADAFSRLCINNRLEWKHRVEEEAASAGGGVGPDAAEAEDMGDGLASELVGMLHEMEEDMFAIDDEVLIPEDIRAQIKLAHNAMVGHSGVQRTVLKLKRLGSSFPSMRDWVDKYIKQCPVC